jgi:hypothetical protein
MEASITTTSFWFSTPTWGEVKTWARPHDMPKQGERALLPLGDYSLVPSRVVTAHSQAQAQLTRPLKKTNAFVVV